MYNSYIGFQCYMNLQYKFTPPIAARRVYYQDLTVNTLKQSKIKSLLKLLAY